MAHFSVPTDFPPRSQTHVSHPVAGIPKKPPRLAAADGLHRLATVREERAHQPRRRYRLLFSAVRRPPGVAAHLRRAPAGAPGGDFGAGLHGAGRAVRSIPTGAAHQPRSHPPEGCPLRQRRRPPDPGPVFAWPDQRLAKRLPGDIPRRSQAPFRVQLGPAADHHSPGIRPGRPDRNLAGSAQFPRQRGDDRRRPRRAFQGTEPGPGHRLDLGPALPGPAAHAPCADRARSPASSSAA